MGRIIMATGNIAATSPYDNYITATDIASIHPRPIPPHKVAIVGFAPTSRDEAPWTDPGWEKWILNDLFQFVDCSQVTRTFHLHPTQQLRDEKIEDEYLRTNDTILHYTWEERPEWPTATRYPDSLLTKYQLPHQDHPYYTNSISYMIAMALEQPNLTQLGIWGVDMAHHTEYAAQRPSCEFFLGIAVAKLGPQNVILPKASDLLRTPYLYGREPISQLVINLRKRKEDVTERRGQFLAQQNSAIANGLKLDGALEVLDYCLTELALPDGTRLPGQDPKETT